MLNKLTAIKVDRTMQGDREVKPPVKCFCCQDSGLVRSNHLNGYVDGESDLDFICNRPSCTMGQKYQNAYFASDQARAEIGKKSDMVYMRSQDYKANFDIRLDAGSCEQLHLLGLLDWQKTLKDAIAKADLIKQKSKQIGAMVDPELPLSDWEDF